MTGSERLEYIEAYRLASNLMAILEYMIATDNNDYRLIFRLNDTVRSLEASIDEIDKNNTDAIRGGKQ